MFSCLNKAMKTSILIFASLVMASCSHRLPVTAQADYSVPPYDFSPYPGPSSREPSAVAYLFNPQDQSCDGLPKLPITSFEGSCLGLVVDPSQGQLLMPRKMIQLPDSDDFLLVDMGGWSSGKGKVYRLSRQNHRFILKEVVTKLNSPHDIEIGPDGKAYVGEMGRIFRFDYHEEKPRIENVLLGFPIHSSEKPHIHPLVNFTFGQSAQDRWDFYVNVGSATDACKNTAPAKCAEVENLNFASVWKFKYEGNGLWNKSPQVFARGLRNSMALLALPSGVVLQAENSRDIKSKEEPFEEINLLRPSSDGRPRHYGWPYCYNFQALSEEWTGSDIECEQGFEKPYSLLPPHSAPLDMLIYQGPMFPQLQGMLLLTLHGYEDTGSRLIAYAVNESGVPQLQQVPQWSYNVWDNKNPQGFHSQPARPRGGVNQHAPYSELISGWSLVNNLRAKGAPVGMAVARDGSIFIVEDKNKSVVRLSRGERYLPTLQVLNSAPLIDVEKYVNQIRSDSRQWSRYQYLRTKFFMKSCTGCHDSMGQKPENQQDELTILRWILSQPNWIVPQKPNESLIYIRTMGLNGTKLMPQEGTKNDPDHTATLKNWILNMK